MINTINFNAENPVDLFVGLGESAEELQEEMAPFSSKDLSVFSSRISKTSEDLAAERKKKVASIYSKTPIPFLTKHEKALLKEQVTLAVNQIKEGKTLKDSPLKVANPSGLKQLDLSVSLKIVRIALDIGRVSKKIHDLRLDMDGRFSPNSVTGLSDADAELVSCRKMYEAIQEHVRLLPRKDASSMVLSHRDLIAREMRVLSEEIEEISQDFHRKFYPKVTKAEPIPIIRRPKEKKAPPLSWDSSYPSYFRTSITGEEQPNFLSP